MLSKATDRPDTLSDYVTCYEEKLKPGEGIEGNVTEWQEKQKTVKKSRETLCLAME